jgi:gas vesicle protein
MAEEREEGFAFLTFIAGAAVGALVGAGVALLLAPQSGAESREDVKEGLRKVSERTEQVIGKLKEMSNDFVQNKKELLGKAVKAYKEGASEMKQELEES